MKKQGANIAGTGDQYSWKQLFNPLSQYTGGGDRYPEFMAKMFPENGNAAWMVSKIGAVGLLALALAGGMRLVEHGAKMRELMESDDPSKNMRNDMGTTFNTPLGDAGPDDKPRKAGGKNKMGKNASATPPIQTVPYPGALNIFKNTINAAVPIGAFAIAAALAYKGADYLADKHRNAVLDKAIANKRKTVRRLMKTRAQQARGVISDEEVQRALDDAMSDDNYIKVAADNHPIVRNSLSSLGLLVLGLGAASAIGSYKYFSLTNPNNIKYKAIKKGLKEYAKAKAGATPLTIVPTDSEAYFKDIAGDAGHGEELPPREQPELVETNKPISMTL